jgi:hypothetical protein
MDRVQRANRIVPTLIPAILFAFSLLVAADARAADPKTRNFYDVLTDVMNDFEQDLHDGAVVGLKDVAIRTVSVSSESVPPSFKEHLEFMINERILRETKTRIIQCLPCRAKRTVLNGDEVTITSPETNPTELSRIAKQQGIGSFVDVAFAYQPSGMILSLVVTDPESGSILWSHAYNSEMTRASYARNGGGPRDPQREETARSSNEYKPPLRYQVNAYYLFEPNFGATTGSLGVGFRMTERYNGDLREVGFEIDYLKTASSLVGGSTASSSADLYGGFDVTALFVHAWNLFGEAENLNKARGSIYGAIGGTYSSGFLGALIRAGYDWRLGKSWVISANAGYRPTSTASSGVSVSGAEFGVGVGMSF